MEVKKDLNNKQREFLDKVYTTQFETIEKAMRTERAEGLAKVQASVVKRLLKDKDIKKMMDAAATFYTLQNKLQPKMDAEGVYVENRLHNESYLRYGTRSYGNVGTAKEVEDYKTETRRLERKMCEKKTEMRGKIWGADASYDVAEKEIKELLKDI